MVKLCTSLLLFWMALLTLSHTLTAVDARLDHTCDHTDYGTTLTSVRYCVTNLKHLALRVCSRNLANSDENLRRK